MAFRNLIIESPATLSVQNRQLIIKTDKEHSVPIEDISAILIENRQTVITTAALSQLGQCGCSVFICNEKHIPCCILEPFMQHSRSLGVIKSQLNASEPLKKRMWQAIVKAKIENQAICLDFNKKSDDADFLRKLVTRVTSGDSENIEAVAAKKYFHSAFGSTFARSDDNGYNAALNYGYAILRGSIARNLAVYGFIPALGLHHKSELNSFNLADDLIEPFRPLADNFVIQNFDESELTPQKKHLLFNLLNLDICLGGQIHSVAYAIERCVQSLGASLKSGENKLCLPTIVEIKQHTYE